MNRFRNFVEPPVSLRGYDAAAASDAVAINTGSESPVQQHLRDEVDVNTIMRRFGVTRVMPSGVAGGVYGDFTGIHDYEDAMEAVARAQRGFMALPPDVRERFGNDPGRLVDFAQQVSEEEFTEAVSVPPVVAVVPPVVAAVVPPVS